MKNEILKIVTIFFVVIGLVLFGLNFIFFNQNAPKSKATGETMSLSFNPPSLTVSAINSDFSTTLLAKPSINTVIRGYKTKVNFDKAVIKLKSIRYKVGSVSAGLGNTDADIATINTNGYINIVGEDTTATGHTLTSVNGDELVSFTFTTITTAPTVVLISDSEFYSVGADAVITNPWTYAPTGLNVNGGVSCTSFTDDFSGTSLNTKNWRLWSSGGGDSGFVSVGNGLLYLNLNATNTVAAQLTNIESINKPLSGDFVSEVTFVARNENPSNEFFQFNGGLQGFAGSQSFDGFGFRVLDGSLQTEVFGSDNPSNPGSQDHSIILTKDTPVKLKLERTGNTIKMSYDLMIGQGYQLLKTFNNFNTAPGRAVIGIQHRGPQNLFVSGSFDNYNQTCSVVNTPTPTPTGGATGNVKLNLKLKFQGINKLPATGENSMTVKVKVQKNGEATSIDGTGTFVADAAGIWSGTVGVNIPTISGKYKIMVKGPQHIQKKICDSTPTETTGAGLYRCSSGNVTLVAGDNNLDFSGILLLAGDLDQNGIVDSVDFGLVKNNLGKTDTETLAKADINRDGKVDTQDFSLIIAALGIRTDEL